MNRNLRIAFSGLALAAAIGGIACGARTEPLQTSNADVFADSGGAPSIAPPIPEAPVVTEKAPIDEPVADPAPMESPKVLWMRSSHAGPGVVVIRFETNVPTTAKVMAMTNQVGPASFYEEELLVPATVHTTSVPASAFGRYKARVEDEHGNIAWAEMRYESDAAGIDWATGAAAPRLQTPNSKQINVTYAFPAGHSSKLGFDGSVHVFVTDAGCTTADSCVGDLLGSALDAPAVANGQLEMHEAITSIPGAAFDYQVVVGQPLNEDASTMVFIQLEVRGDELPKVKVQGPGNIKAN